MLESCDIKLKKSEMCKMRFYGKIVIMRHVLISQQKKEILQNSEFSKNCVVEEINGSIN